MLKFYNDAKLKAGVFFREWKEKQEAKKALNAVATSEHGHGRFFLLHVPAIATICAAVVEWYWAILFCIEATGHVDWNYETTAASDAPATAIWNFAFAAHWPVLVGLVCATIPIVMLSMVWLPVQFSMRGTGRWRRGTVIVVGILANVLVIVSGTVVLNYNRQEQVRDALVVEQSADAGRAAIGARLTVAQTELARITAEGNTSNEARAARAGVQGWQTYIREAQNDPGVPAADRQRIVRAMGSAEAADRLRARIEELTVQQATAAPTASTAVTVEDTVGHDLNAFARFVEVWRPPFVALICTLIGICGSWWVLALMQGLNPRDVLRSGWADESHRIEDLREEEAIAPQPMKPAREVVTDAETGEELLRVRESKPRDYWRKVKKGKKTRVEVPGETLADETGFQDSARSGVTLGGVMELPATEATALSAEATPVPDAEGERIEPINQDAPTATDWAPVADETRELQPDLQSDEEAAQALQEELAATDEVAGEDQRSQPDNNDRGNDEPEQIHHQTSEREEPETRESHMLPNVAAE